MTRYAVGLGSNLGDRLAHLRRARAALDELGSGLVVSSLYETAPVGGPDQGPYLNAVAVFESEHSPHELLTLLQGIEQEAGRERTVRWGPRTLDLDIVASDGPPVSTSDLTVPHPRAAEREFVLRPLVEVWPDALVGPVSSAAEALADVQGQGVERLARDWSSPPPWHGLALVVGQLVLFVVLAIVLFVTGRPPWQIDVFLLVGAMLVLVGIGLAGDGARRLGTALTPSPIPRPGSMLVTTGPYRYVRHPIYGGISLTAIGASLVAHSFWGMVVSFVLVAYLWLKSGYEERLLRMRHAGYRTYREAVPKRLIPLVL